MITRYLKTDPARYMLISSASLVAGILFYAFYNKLIVIRLPHQSGATERRAFRRKTSLWYWKDDRFISEKRELIYASDIQVTLTNLVAAWLTLLKEESVLPQQVTVSSIMVDPHKRTVFISFDRSPFTKAQSTISKLMFLEALLKSIRSSHIPLTKVYFLAEHKPIEDSHLDFTHPWTINGYLPQ